MGTVQNQKVSVDQLNSFLRGELSAVETYRIALYKLDKASFARLVGDLICTFASASPTSTQS